MNIKKEVGSRVRAVRIARKFTQEKLSEIIGISPQALSRIERGDNFFSAELLVRLSVALKIRPSVLFDFDCDFETRKIDVEGVIINDVMKTIKNNPSKIVDIKRAIDFAVNAGA